MVALFRFPWQSDSSPPGSPLNHLPQDAPLEYFPYKTRDKLGASPAGKHGTGPASLSLIGQIREMRGRLYGGSVKNSANDLDNLPSIEYNNNHSHDYGYYYGGRYD